MVTLERQVRRRGSRYASHRRLGCVMMDTLTCTQLIVPTTVIRNACGNGDGLFWAGDTAQTISAGRSAVLF
jgi:hypothetical protein